MSAESEEVIITENEPTVLTDDDIEETGSLLLTAVCCEDPPFVPRLRVSKSNKTAAQTRKKRNSALSPANATANSSVQRKKKVITSINPPAQAKKKAVKLGEGTDSDGKRQYRCSLCSKCYQQPSSLLTHMRLHTGERPFTCKVCGKSFVQSGHLTSHMRLHTGERPHACTVCDKRFGAAGDLKVSMFKRNFNIVIVPSCSVSLGISQGLDITHGNC